MTGTHLDTTSLLGHPGLMQGRPSTRLTTITLHPVRRDEHQAVLDLVDADRMPGQPQAGPADLREALAGRSPIDGALWAGLTDLRHDVAVDSTGNVLGVIATGWRALDSTAVLTWMHARENRAVLSVLLNAAPGTLLDDQGGGVRHGDRTGPRTRSAAGSAPASHG
jgi:hypothetical protein